MPDALDLAEACLTCGRPLPTGIAGRTEHHPFCCARCRDADLGRWFGEEHRVRLGPALSHPDPDVGEPPLDPGD
jgi:hypothetical protein